MKVLTAAQMRNVDRLTTERHGIASLQLMENAGAAVVSVLRDKIAGLTRCSIAVLCGKGNNGGDGLVVARLLKAAGSSPRVILFAQPTALEGDAAINFKRWHEVSGELQAVTTAAEWESVRPLIENADLVVDALMGTGLRGPVEGACANAITDLNAARARRPTGKPRARIVSVDIPSGLPSDGQDFGGPIVEADFTVTFTAPKLGQLVSPRASSCGVLIVRNIGTPAELLESNDELKLHWLEPGEFRDLPLVRAADSNKGTYGHVLLVVGSLGKSGAAILGARAALRSGAGLVTVATPLPALPIVAAGMPEIMTAPLAATESGTASLANLDYGRFHEIARGKSVIAIGPGLSTHVETQQFIRVVAEETELPLILDADGLNAFEGAADRLAKHSAPGLALTPHPGEMARLLGITAKDVQASRLKIAMDAASHWGAYVILKGFHTILATPAGDAYVNTTGNAGMATAGTGDMLTGLLAGLTAQFGISHWERVLGFGVYLHGLAGDIAASHVGQAPLIASDLIDAIPEAFAQVLAERFHEG